MNYKCFRTIHCHRLWHSSGDVDVTPEGVRVNVHVMWPHLASTTT